MKLGFLTAALPMLSLEQIAAWAAETSYEALEVATWPSAGRQFYEAAHLPVETFGAREAEHTHELLERHGLSISALAYYENNLHPDPARRDAIRTHLKRVIDTASTLGVPSVGTFIGRDWTKPVAENMADAEPAFREIVDYAGERGVKVTIENCPMEGWHPDGYPANLAYSPELWEWMFDLGLYLNWDPSHLVWQGIDPLATIAPYAHRIVHAQAKDIEIQKDRINRYGIFGKAVRENPWDVGWWRYRVPGRGQIDWSPIIDALYEHGFTGTLSVEHEDPVWRGGEQRIKTGLKIAESTLRPLIVL
ncbi:sugar phosphate isomerase [Rhodococcus sp. SRB_17]|nr:sugar phosphate isomerase [Rhodococcus sp. SRB_17]